MANRGTLVAQSVATNPLKSGDTRASMPTIDLSMASIPGSTPMGNIKKCSLVMLGQQFRDTQYVLENARGSMKNVFVDPIVAKAVNVKNRKTTN